MTQITFIVPKKILYNKEKTTHLSRFKIYSFPTCFSAARKTRKRIREGKSRKDRAEYHETFDNAQPHADHKQRERDTEPENRREQRGKQSYRAV